MIAACGGGSGGTGLTETPDVKDGKDGKCFVPSDCKADEFCAKDQACQTRLPAGGGCDNGEQCQTGLFCLRTYSASGQCKAVPDSCKSDICGCYATHTPMYCAAGTNSNCDSTGQSIYCTKFP
jgi:hypothetical protein